MTHIPPVEDDELNRGMLPRRLELKGYTVAIAVDGREATRRIRASGSQVPVIALTAHAMEGDKQKARDAGGNDDDTKPVELPPLPAKIEALPNIPKQ